MEALDRQALGVLLGSAEPSVRYLARVQVLGEAPDSPQARELRAQVARSDRAAALLSEREAGGRIPWHPYAKWYGAHWVLADLAGLGYPPGDPDLLPLREQVLEWLLGRRSRYHSAPSWVVAGKARRCASQEGNALWALLRLGLADERCEALARLLVGWQWPDGGWNCDRRPEARSSSFMETLIPMRALAQFGRDTGAAWASQAARRAAEVFLERRLFRRRSNGEVIATDFLVLHYPCYWHYDLLAGLKALAEMGLAGDPRCREALDRLDGKRLPCGGWPAEARYWRQEGRTGRPGPGGLVAAASPAPGPRPDPGRSTSRRRSGASLVSWGPTGRTRPNPWVTLDALTVRRAL